MERTYTIPLRKEWLKAPKYLRAKKAIRAVQEFLIRHMKSEDVRIMGELNQEIWKHGMKNPPAKVKVNVAKDKDDVVRAQLVGHKIVEPTPEEPEKKGLAKIAERMKGKEAPKAEAREKETKEEKKPEAVAEKKEEKAEAPQKEEQKERKEEITKPEPKETKGVKEEKKEPVKAEKEAPKEPPKEKLEEKPETKS